MRILLTGATGYIGKRLMPVLLEEGHEIICCVRDKTRFEPPRRYRDQVSIFEVDFLKPVPLKAAPRDFDIAYYLIHSMSASISAFEELEARAARHFCAYINKTGARQIIYLSGITNPDKLSPHLASRQHVEEILMQSEVPLTTLKAGIIVGSGSASFEIIRDLVEKLPVMTAPKWVHTRCQPIAIRNVIEYLTKVKDQEDCLNASFEIGGPDVLTYKQMLEQYAKERKLKRWIITIPVMTPRLSSYWLYFVTATSYNLAVNLVNSMKVDVVVKDFRIRQMLPLKLISYREAVRLAFLRTDQNLVISSWKDALVSSSDQSSLKEFIQVPSHGCYVDHQQIRITQDPAQVLHNIWSIGGQKGWYYGNSLWRIRGYLDKLVGGVGLRRGRTHDDKIIAGDALDFWRVLVADKEERRLLLYAEMKVPGEAWLEFDIRKDAGGDVLHQTATFRPKGLIGRMYWYLMMPLHFFVFSGMIRNIASGKS